MLKTIVDRYRNMPVASKAGLWFVVCSCIQSGIKFLSLPIFANMMSVAQYGNVTLYTSWMSVMFIFATLALGNANGVYYVAMVKFPSSRDQFTSCMQGLTVALCLVCFSVAGLSTCLLGDWMGIGVAQYPISRNVH